MYTTSGLDSSQNLSPYASINTKLLHSFMQVFFTYMSLRYKIKKPLIARNYQYDTKRLTNHKVHEQNIRLDCHTMDFVYLNMLCIQITNNPFLVRQNLGELQREKLLYHHSFNQPMETIKYTTLIIKKELIVSPPTTV